MEILGYEYADKFETAKQHLADQLYTTYNPNARTSNGDFTNTRGDGDDSNPLWSITAERVTSRPQSTEFNSNPSSGSETFDNIETAETIFERGNRHGYGEVGIGKLPNNGVNAEPSDRPTQDFLQLDKEETDMTSSSPSERG